MVTHLRQKQLYKPEDSLASAGSRHQAYNVVVVPMDNEYRKLC